VLELHGWGDLQTELNTLSKQGRWVEMGELIDDQILDAFAVVAPPDRVAARLGARFGGWSTGSASTRPTSAMAPAGARSSRN